MAVQNSTEKAMGIYREMFICVMDLCVSLAELFVGIGNVHLHTWLRAAHGHECSRREANRHIYVIVHVSRLTCGLVNCIQSIWE